MIRTVSGIVEHLLYSSTSDMDATQNKNYDVSIAPWSGGVCFKGERCGCNAFLLRNSKTTKCYEDRSLSTCKSEAFGVSRLHDSKSDEGLAFCACTIAKVTRDSKRFHARTILKATKVSHFAPRRIRKNNFLHIPLHMHLLLRMQRYMCV